VPYVYLLRCADDSLYCGWTTDVERRLAAHRAGTASRYTRSRLPVELAAVMSVADRSAALREEARIKRLSRVAKLELADRKLDDPDDHVDQDGQRDREDQGHHQAAGHEPDLRLPARPLGEEEHV
jgi:putative endonuclease